jgi:hypothetical protein
MSLKIKQSLLALYTILFIGLSGCASHEKQAAEDASLKSATEWLNYLDTAATEELWSATSKLTKSKEDKELLLKKWRGINTGLGAVRERDLQLNFVVEPYQFRGNIPNGVYRRIVFWSKYQYRDNTKEELIMSFEDGQWKCLQYLVN